jgi:cell division protein FtsB
MNIKFIRDRRLWWVTIIVFILLIAVVDRNNLIDRYQLRNQIYELEAERDYYLERIAEDSLLLLRLRDNAFLERYARERYMFRKEGEQLYIIR